MAEVIVFEGTDAAGHAVTYQVTVPTGPVDRSTLVYGDYLPVSGVNCGLLDPNPPGGWTTMGTGGTITLSTANAHYENVIFNGIVVINALGITGSNCQFRGSATVTNATGSIQPCIKGSSGL